MRRALVFAIWFWGFSAAAPAQPAAQTAPPDGPINVLLVLVDQHHARCLGVAGNGFGGLERSLSPNLDQLAAEGVRFENAFVCQAQCAPERFTLLTGLWPHEHGLRWNQVWEPPGALTLPELARDVGWATATIGKHHMMWLDQPRPLEEDHGFELVVSRKQYAQHCAQHGVPQYNAPGNHWSLPALPDALAPVGYTLNADPFHPVGFYADRTIAFLEERAGPQGDGRPFVCWFATDGPHPPILPSGPADPHDFAHAFAPFDALGLPPNQERQATLPRLAKLQQAYSKFDPWRHRQVLGRYYGAIHQIDHDVGRVLDRLEALGLAERTLVVFTADHGEMAGEMGCWTKGGGNYDAVVRVPLIARLPGVLPAGKVVSELVSAVDVFPTLLEVTGLPIEDADRLVRSGAPLVDLMTRPEPPPDWRTELFVEYGTLELANAGQVRTVRTLDAKLCVDTLEGGGEEFYWLAHDPWEDKDLRADPQHQDTVADLRARLEAWWSDGLLHAPLYLVSGPGDAPPAPASVPAPAHGAPDVPRDVDLRWVPSTAAWVQRVHLGPDPQDLPLVALRGPMVDRYNPGNLPPGVTLHWRVDQENRHGSSTSPTWSFTTGAAPDGPGLASGPSPAHEAQGVAPDATLAWSAAPGAATHDVWFGVPGDLRLVASDLPAAAPSFAPGPLDAGFRYAWRVDARDAAGVTEGDEWTFVTDPSGLPKFATAPTPAHLAEDVPAPPGFRLEFAPAPGATEHRVHFGESFPLPLVATVSDGSWEPGPLVPGRTYRWRVDERNALGTRRGFTWRFRVAE